MVACIIIMGYFLCFHPCGKLDSKQDCWLNNIHTVCLFPHFYLLFGSVFKDVMFVDHIL